MKTARVVSVAVMALALMVWLVVPAQAGGGGLGLGGLLFFQCYFVAQGTAPGHVLEVDDVLSNPTAIKLGKLKMHCTPADATVLNDLPLTVIDPFNLALDQLACYEVPGSTKAAAAPVTLDTALGAQTVQTGGPSKFVCVQACLGLCP